MLENPLTTLIPLTVAPPPPSLVRSGYSVAEPKNEEVEKVGGSLPCATRAEAPRKMASGAEALCNMLKERMMQM